jgi:hypothetical protein
LDFAIRPRSPVLAGSVRIVAIDPAMLSWWSGLAGPAQDTWCGHARGEGKITDAMADGVPANRKGSSDAGMWIAPIVATVERVTADETWQMLDPFRGFIRDRCGLV